MEISISTIHLDINITRTYTRPLHKGDNTSHIIITILTVFLTFLSVMIIMSNLLTIVTIIISRQLRKTTYYLIASLATADMLIGLTITPFFILWLREHALLENPYFCKMVLITSLFLTSASIVNLMTLTIERYLAICHPIFHKFLMSHENFIKTAISVEWLLCVLLTLFSSFVGLKSNSKGKTCTYYQGFNEEFIQGALIVGVMLPFVIMFTLYTKILHATQKHLKLKRDLSHTSESPQEVEMKLQKVKHNLSHTSESPQEVETKLQKIKRNLSNTSESSQQAETKLQKIKHNHKMTITLCLIFTSFVLSWGPLFTVIFTQAVCSSCTVPDVVKDLIVLLGSMHSLSNPIIYSLRQPNFKNIFRQSIRRIYSKTQYFLLALNTKQNVQKESNPIAYVP